MSYGYRTKNRSTLITPTVYSHATKLRHPRPKYPAGGRSLEKLSVLKVSKKSFASQVGMAFPQGSVGSR